MSLGRHVGAALLCAALAVSASAGAGAGAPLPLDGTLPGGGRYVVRPLGGAPVAGISLWYRASSSGFAAPATPGIGRLAATAVAASQPVTGTPLGTFVNRLGGRMDISAYPESIEISLLVPADRAGEALRALTRSFFAPVLTDEGLDAARRTISEETALRGLNSDASITDALYASLFASGPAQQPPYSRPGALSTVTADQIRAYAERAFRPANAILVLTGDVTPELTLAALAGREDAAAGAESPAPEVLASPAPVVTRSDEAGFGLAWAGPPITDEAAATAFDFIADYLFGDDGTVQRAALTSGTDIEGTFVTYHNPGVFIITATGGDITAARAAVDAGLAEIRKPLAPEVFEKARRRFVYGLLSHSQTPDLLADNFGWYAVEGNLAYAPGDGGMSGRYFSAVDALTPAFVAATAAKYLSRPGATVTVSAAPPAILVPPSVAPAPSPSPPGARS